MNRRNALFSAAVLTLSLATGGDSTAFASPDTVKPGRQSTPPGPKAPAPPALQTDPGQRRAIRGCPVEMDCRGPALEGLREFELETFGRPSEESPWLEDPLTGDVPDSRSKVQRVRRQGLGAAARGTDLRPDLPWLDKLAMPDIPVRWNHRLIEYLVFYKDDRRGRNIMRGWLRAQGKYRDLIVSHLRAARLPEDLLYVAMIESSYDPGERSRVGAAGLWQFMPAGGRIYGLAIDRWIDERNDPVRSTEAAMLYWADLYQRFGDWHLAMAAYNGGYGAVLRAVATFNSNDYWELSDHENALPWGTSLYVPKALAAAIVGRNREFFGMDDVKANAEVTWDNVSVPKSVSLATIARAAGTKVEAIRDLNPQLRRNRTPPRRKDYVVRVPGGKAQLFAERFPQLRGDWDKYDAFVVAHGQRFEDVATMHGIHRRRLARLNGVSHESEVRGGMVLVVPKVTQAQKQKNLEKARESLYASGSPRGKKGEKLIVALPDKSMKVKGKKRVFYRVVTGDSQYGIAKTFGISRAELAAWNGLRRDAHLHPRMVLQVFIPRGFKAKKRGIDLLDPKRLHIVTRGSQEHLDGIETRRGRERIVYKAKKRESFETIGKKYGLTARDLARINNKPHSTQVEAGDEIVVYRVVERSRSERAKAQAREQSRNKRNRARKAPTKKRSPAKKPAVKPSKKPANKPTKKRESSERRKPKAESAPAKEPAKAEKAAEKPRESEKKSAEKPSAGEKKAVEKPGKSEKSAEKPGKSEKSEPRDKSDELLDAYEPAPKASAETESSDGES